MTAVAAACVDLTVESEEEENEQGDEADKENVVPASAAGSAYGVFLQHELSYRTVMQPANPKLLEPCLKSDVKKLIAQRICGTEEGAKKRKLDTYLQRNKHLSIAERKAVHREFQFPADKPVYHSFKAKEKGAKRYAAKVTVPDSSSSDKQRQLIVYRAVKAAFDGVLPLKDQECSHILHMADIEQQRLNVNPHHLVWEGRAANVTRNFCRGLYFSIRHQSPQMSREAAAVHVQTHVCSLAHPAPVCSFYDPA